MAAPAKKTTKVADPEFSDGTQQSEAQLEKENPELLQSPSLVGEVDVEIAKRSADVPERESQEHRKVFVIPRGTNVETGDFGGEEYEQLHAANIDGMRQGMILAGLRPTEDGRFVGAEVSEDGTSFELTYAAECVPAVVATAEQNVVAVTVEDQHRLDEQTAETSPEK